MSDQAIANVAAVEEPEGRQPRDSEPALQLVGRLAELSALLRHRCSLQLEVTHMGGGGGTAPRRLVQVGSLSANNLTRSYNAMWGLEVREDPFGGSCTVRLAREELRAGELVEVCPLLRITAEPQQIAALSVHAAVCGHSSRNVDVPCSDQQQAFFAGGFACLYRRAQRGTEEANLEPRICGDELLWFARRPLRGGDELLAPNDWPNLVDVETCAPPPLLPEGIPGSRALVSQAARLPGPGHVLYGPSHVHGAGVFSARAYACGEVVEVCPALKLRGAAAKAARDYCMACGDCHSSGLDEEWVASSVVLAMGLGAVYNHREAPQLEWFYDGETSTVVFAAAERVDVGEELFIDYGASYWQGRHLVPL